MTDTSHYIQNAAGGVQIVTDTDYRTHLLTNIDEAGIAHLKTGYKELTRAEAKKLRPQLFGVPDPNIHYTAKELVAKAQYAKQLKEFETASKA